MRYSTKLAILAVVAVFLLAPSAQAAPCTAGAQTLAFRATEVGCDFNGYLFDFSQAPGISVAQGSALSPGTTSVSLGTNTNVTLTAIVAGLVTEIQFDAIDATTSWSVGGDSIVTFNYFYTITPIPMMALVTVDYRVVNAQSMQFGGVTGFKLAEELSSNVTNQTGVGISGAQAGAGFFDLTNSVTFSGFQGAVKIQDSITLTEALGGVSSVGALGSQGSLVNTLTYEPVPEPFTMLLSGAGLIGLAMLKRRKQKV
jgi:hypothetical protein